MNGSKDNAKIVKTYVCKCGEVNRFSFETDFNFNEIRIDACCQGCGKDISISVENYFKNPINGISNINGNVANGAGTNNICNGYGTYNNNTNSSYSQPSYSQSTYPSSSSSQSSYSTSSPSTTDTSAQAMQEFNFDALTSAAGSISEPSALESASSNTSSSSASNTYADSSGSNSSSGSSNAPIDYAGIADTLGSITSEIISNDEPELPEVAEPAPSLLAKNVVTTAPTKKVEEVKEEDADMLSKEEEYYGEDASTDEKEAFLDLFGRM